MQEHKPSLAKKQYSPPTLRVYGALEQLTQSNPNMGGATPDTRGTMMDVRTH
jgi:hypothetical protein